MLQFNTDDMAIQKFDAFPKTIMNYSLKNFKPHHLVKLYQTAKYFYNKFSLNIIQSLEIDEEEPEIFGLTKTIVKYTNPVLLQLKDFCIFDSLICRTIVSAGDLPMFPNCKIKKLEMFAYLYWADYIALTKAGTIQELKIAGVFGQNDYVPIEKIIAEVPNATSIQISPSFLNKETMNSLIALNHKVKISNFVLKYCFCKAGHVKEDLLVDFFCKHGVDNCEVVIHIKLWPRRRRPKGSKGIYDYTKLIAVEIEKNKKMAV